MKVYVNQFDKNEQMHSYNVELKSENKKSQINKQISSAIRYNRDNELNFYGIRNIIFSSGMCGSRTAKPKCKYMWQ